MKALRGTLTVSMPIAVLMLVARQVGAATLDETVAPGHNYDKAEFRLWYPDAAGRSRPSSYSYPDRTRSGECS